MGRTLDLSLVIFCHCSIEIVELEFCGRSGTILRERGGKGVDNIGIDAVLRACNRLLAV